MSLRTRIRNWLLKPSADELANVNGQGTTVAELVWGHVSREMKREVVHTCGVDTTADGLVFSEGMPAGTLAFEQPAAREVDLGEIDLARQPIREIVRDEVARLEANKPPIRIINMPTMALDEWFSDARDDEVLLRIIRNRAASTPSPVRSGTPRELLGAGASFFRLAGRAIAARLGAILRAASRGRGAS